MKIRITQGWKVYFFFEKTAEQSGAKRLALDSRLFNRKSKSVVCLYQQREKYFQVSLAFHG